MNSSPIAGLYFDGRSSTPRTVTLHDEGRDLVLTLQGSRQARVSGSRLRVSERLARSPRLLHFADGSYVEVRDHAELDALLAAIGFKERWVVRWQNHWPAALAAVVATIGFVWAGYVYLLPQAAAFVAQQIPMNVEERIGREAVAIIDRRLFRPSELSPERQQALREQFVPLAELAAGERRWRVEFRSSRIGPNAVALPGGLILVTDDLVHLAPSDDAIVAVMAHELGHIHQRHFLRRVVSSAVMGAAVTLIAGDASGVLTAIPATVAELGYSRDMEREADRYAIDLLHRAGRSAEPLAQMLEAMEIVHRRGSPTADPKAEKAMRDYMSTHPATAERIEAIRNSR